MLREFLEKARVDIDRTLEQTSPALEPREVGAVLHIGGGIAQLSGLPGLRSEELVQFPKGLLGLAANLEADEAGVMLLGPSEALGAGAEARATGRLADTAVGEGLLGRIVDGLGRPLDGKGAITTSERRPVERDAPAIMDRAPVTEPLATGIKVVDAVIPIGRGQRELILGDRQTGKTTIAVDTILNQRGEVICIYCAIGQRRTAVARVAETLAKHGALPYCIVVVASGDDAPGLQFITPYAATAMAEYFMERGRHVLIVYDDLTRHARVYRELSLLLRRPPGREAFPGDIFYIHSRLLERATQLRAEHGGGSLTALPIIETQAQDISAYIATNLISITDGQIYVSPDLFRKAHLPAVDIGKSVSRVGGKAQLPAYRKIAGALRLAYSQFEELETFARFATRLDDATRATIERGRRVRAVLKQAEHDPMAVAEQIAVLLAATTGLLDQLPVETLEAFETMLRARLREAHADLCEKFAKSTMPDEGDWEALREVVSSTASGLATGNGS